MFFGNACPLLAKNLNKERTSYDRKNYFTKTLEICLMLSSEVILTI
jgi:hypothetical protein